MVSTVRDREGDTWIRQGNLFYIQLSDGTLCTLAHGTTLQRLRKVYGPVEIIK